MIGEYPLPAPDRKTWVLTVKHLCGRITKIYVVLRALVRSFVYFHQLNPCKNALQQRVRSWKPSNRAQQHRVDHLATDGGSVSPMPRSMAGAGGRNTNGRIRYDTPAWDRRRTRG